MPAGGRLEGVSVEGKMSSSGPTPVSAERRQSAQANKTARTCPFKSCEGVLVGTLCGEMVAFAQSAHDFARTSAH